MANRKYHSYLLFATHSHASEIFPGFLRELNLEDDNFRDVSRGLNFLKKKKLRYFARIFHCGAVQNRQNIIRAKINPLKRYQVLQLKIMKSWIQIYKIQKMNK